MALLVLIIIFIILLFVKANKKESFDGNLTYGGMDFKFNRDRSDPAFSYIVLRDNTLVVPDHS